MICWINILLAYKDGKFDRYYYGLTPKLLVGACQKPMESKFENEQIAYEVTKRMFDEMQSYEYDGLIVTSNHCEIHNGPVIKLVEGKVTKNSIGTDFDKIWTIYSEEIIEGNFGINSYDRNILKTISD
jgi:hypothetical protein